MANVSVIIPTYNRTSELIRAVHSVLQQSYQDFEIIVIDDCSTLEMSDTWKALSDQRIQIVVNESNLTAGPSRNKGAFLASGRFIAFLDSDDTWASNHLQLRLDAFEGDASIDGFYGASTLYEDNTAVVTSQVHSIRKTDSMLDYLLSGRLMASTPSIMVKREAFLNVKFDESLVHHEDYNFLIRFHEKYQWGCIEESTVQINESSSSMSLGKAVNHESCIKAIKAYTNRTSFKNLFNYCRSMASDKAARESDRNNYLDLLAQHTDKRPWNYVLKFNVWSNLGLKPIGYIEKIEWLFRRYNKAISFRTS